MDIRRWFATQERPNPDQFYPLIHHVPDTRHRCPAVMKVFVAGFSTGFALTDEEGQPTEVLRIMVAEMGGTLCQADGLDRVERRKFTHTQGALDYVFNGRWFIRDISRRLQFDAGATGYYGWLGQMFYSNTNRLLMSAKVSETSDGERQRSWRFLVCCPSDWDLNGNIYAGLHRWTHGDHLGRSWDAYGYLDCLLKKRPSPAARSKGGANRGRAQVVSA